LETETRYEHSVKGRDPMSGGGRLIKGDEQGEGEEGLKPG